MAAGKLYTEEKADAPQTLKSVTISGKPSYEATNSFTLRPDEALYGFGFTADDTSNRRGKDLLLVQTNVGIIIPVMMSIAPLWRDVGHLFADALQGRCAGRVAVGGKRAGRGRLLLHGRRHTRRRGRRLSRG